MPETRAAVKRRRLEAMVPLHEWPYLLAVLSYLDVASLVQVGSVNLFFREKVYDTSLLWKRIQFKGCIDQAARLTDAHLEQLLQRCRAGERCVSLNLNGCTGVSGAGLEPLRGSHCLREVDLRLNVSGDTFGPVEINSHVVFPILNSMPPFAPHLHEPQQVGEGGSYGHSTGLTSVKFRPQRNVNHFFSQFTDPVSDWYYSFVHALVRQAKQRRTTCGHCQRVISEVIPERELFWVLSGGYCECCTHRSCMHGDCPIVKQCHSCRREACDDFYSKCTEGVFFLDCESCDASLCEDCFEGVVCSNPACCKCICESCTNHWEQCPFCEDDFCVDCIEEHKYSEVGAMYESVVSQRQQAPTQSD